jgi:hypothetical protein
VIVPVPGLAVALELPSSSKSREMDTIDSKMNQPAEGNANFQLDGWLSPAWNNFEPTDQGTGWWHEVIQ